ncbi:hypothetical protein HGRIS_006815 [Hohenbuehelia grisea]|uniref:CCHC-type domain-containing protein n=1 Tax=Hohenbuehelia grisea TaxID=104357 RepID=A0ABR3JA76_9AGAR
MSDDPHNATAQQGEAPPQPNQKCIPYTTAAFPLALNPTTELLGGIDPAVSTAIRSNPSRFIAILPFNGGRSFTESNPNFATEVLSLLNSFQYENCGDMQLTRAPWDNKGTVGDPEFAKPWIYILRDAPPDLRAMLVWQQTFSFRSKKGAAAFHALSFTQERRPWGIMDIEPEPGVKHDDNSRSKVLRTIVRTLWHLPAFRNIAKNTQENLSLRLSEDEKVLLATASLRLVTHSRYASHRTPILQLRGKPMFLNDKMHHKWLRIIRSARYLVEDIIRLEVKEVILACTYCKDRGHATAECPFPDFPDWRGPKPRTGTLRKGAAVLGTRSDSGQRRWWGDTGHH